MSEEESDKFKESSASAETGKNSVSPENVTDAARSLNPQRSSSGDSLIAGPSASSQPARRAPFNAVVIDAGENKWQCDTCTYLNYMSSIRCTICRSTRSLGTQLIEDSEVSSTSTRQASSTNRPVNNIQNNTPTWPTTTTDTFDTNNSTQICEDTSKWSCQKCTYLNWPKSQRCVQCSAKRPTPSTSGGGGANNDCASSVDSVAALQVLINNNINSGNDQKTSIDSTGAGDNGGSRSSRQLSPLLQVAGPSGTVHPKSSQDSSVSPLDSRIIAKKLQKWTCKMCTYENWPKAPKCTMCYAPKANGADGDSSRRASRASPQLQTHSGQRSPNNNNNNCNNTNSGDDPGSQQQQSVSSPTTAVKRMHKSSSSHEPVGRKSPKSSSPPSVDSSHENLASAASTAANNNNALRINAGNALEQHLRRVRNKPGHHLDFLWLTAVRSLAVSTCDCDPVEAYLAAGGDPTRPLTQHEVCLLQGALPDHGFETGQTLVHLAVRCQREDLVTLLLSATTVTAASNRASNVGSSASASSPLNTIEHCRPNVKRVPSHASPDTAAAIKHLIAMSLRQRKCEMPCYYFTDLTTFSLPAKICDLSPPIQRVLFDELLDKNVQKELEEECAIINWSLEICDCLGSRLYALWNRTAGDCLLDSVLQATWAVFDSENSLRQALHDSLSQADHVFYPRWREYELLVSKAMQFSLDESQLARDWQLILRLASKPGSALEQVHVFALAHIIRRPIIVYGVRVVKSLDGDHLDYARFEGVYLPLLWEPSFCLRSPICLGYTRGHFVALVPMQPSRQRLDRATTISGCAPRYAYLPLQDADGKLLPVHFLSQNEYGHEGLMMRTWLDATVTDGGLWCCKMKLHKQPALVEQMLDEWLDYYTRLGRMTDAAAAGVSGVQSSAHSRSNTPTNHIISIPVSATRLRHSLADTLAQTTSSSTKSSSSDHQKQQQQQLESTGQEADSKTTSTLLHVASQNAIVGYEADNSSSDSEDER